MTAKKHRGVEIDVCEEHGVWLDVGELEAIVERVKKLGRYQLRRAREDGKVSGYIWGPLAFLFDKLPPRSP